MRSWVDAPSCSLHNLMAIRLSAPSQSHVMIVCLNKSISVTLSVTMIPSCDLFNLASRDCAIQPTVQV